MGEAKEMAANRWKIEREAQREDRGVYEITFESWETSIGGVVYGKGEMVSEK